MRAGGSNDVLEVEGGRPLRGRVHVPGDKSISHRALLIAARAEGTSRIRGLAGGDDVARTAAAVEALGAGLRPGAVAGELAVDGGEARLAEPAAPLYLGNSGTGMRLLAGWVAAFDWLVVLTGDASLSSRPMDRVARPLSLMGAHVDGRRGGCLPPLVVRGGGLQGIDFTPPQASAQVKSAILLAGLGADGETVVREAVATRAHTEEMLESCGARIEVERRGGGQLVRVRRSALTPLDLDVPADPSQAAFWVVAASIVPGSEVAVEGVYVGPGRAGFLEVLERMGADVELTARRGQTADIVARYSELQPTEVSGSEVPGVIDEIPVLAVAATAADGRSEFADAGELAVKESNRIATMEQGLRAMAGRAEGRWDGIAVAGGGSLRGATVDSAGDHRVAMALAVAAMAAEGTTLITGWDAVATSYPGFADDLARLSGAAG